MQNRRNPQTVEGNLSYRPQRAQRPPRPPRDYRAIMLCIALVAALVLAVLLGEGFLALVDAVRGHPLESWHAFLGVVDVLKGWVAAGVVLGTVAMVGHPLLETYMHTALDRSQAAILREDARRRRAIRRHNERHMTSGYIDTADEQGNYTQVREVGNGRPVGYLLPGNAQGGNAGINPQHLLKFMEKINTVEEVPQLPSGEGALPDYISYADVRPNVPRKHALVGVDGHGVVSRLREEIKALIWIVGASGTGKTRSVCIRIEEDYADGHEFYLIDPHWFKPDSLWNAVKNTVYAQRLVLPMASETSDSIAILDAFLSDFSRRKSGEAWKNPRTLIIDEVGSMTSDKPETEEDRTLRDKIKQVARICGQEARDFGLAGIYISQTATGLSWLRKNALLVIAHQLTMMSERKVACNENMEVARNMDTWPIGRTYVYGIGLKGPRLVQQPYYEPPIVEGTLVDEGISGGISGVSPGVSPEEEEEDLRRYPGDSALEPMETANPETSENLTQAQKIKLLQVLELDSQQKSQNDIIRTIWGHDPKHRQGIAAAEELRLIRAYIAQEQRRKLGL